MGPRPHHEFYFFYAVAHLPSTLRFHDYLAFFAAGIPVVILKRGKSDCCEPNSDGTDEAFCGWFRMSIQKGERHENQDECKSGYSR
jgi:hypothetical protein